MDLSRAVTEFVSLGGKIFRLLNSEDECLSALDRHALRAQLHTLQVQLNRLEPRGTPKSSFATGAAHLTETLERGPFVSHHEVVFYQDDQSLIESVSAFVRVGLDVGETVIVIAIPQHATSLQETLQPEEFKNERLLFLDANDLLSRVMLDYWPSESRFINALDPILQLASRNGRVRIFGEMVGLLWAQRRRSAAMRLEELWDILTTWHKCSLLCTYPQSEFFGNKGSKSKMAISKLHRPQ